MGQASGERPHRDTRDDELLQNIPEVQAGGFAGYRAGKGVRRRVFGSVALAVVVAVGAGVWWAKRQEAILRAGTGGQYEVDPEPDGTQARPREMVWSSGRARLGLSRHEPGVNVIRLPDRTVRLAAGYDHAQINVDIRGGKTVRLDVLVGDVEVELLQPN